MIEASAPAEPRPNLMTELRDAVAPRTVGLVVGVLLLQLGFISSYVGAFHAPTPHHISITVVAPAQVSGQFIDGLNGLPGEPLAAAAATNEAAARAQLADGVISAVLVVNPSGTADMLLVASGGGTSVATRSNRCSPRSKRPRSAPSR